MVSVLLTDEIVVVIAASVGTASVLLAEEIVSKPAFFVVTVTVLGFVSVMFSGIVIKKKPER